MPLVQQPNAEIFSCAECRVSVNKDELLSNEYLLLTLRIHSIISFHSELDIVV